MVKGTPVGANRGVVGWMEMGKAEADRSPNSVEKRGEGGNREGSQSTYSISHPRSSKTVV